jgi:hypothetical protein
MVICQLCLLASFKLVNCICYSFGYKRESENFKGWAYRRAQEINDKLHRQEALFASKFP